MIHYWLAATFSRPHRPADPLTGLLPLDAQVCQYALLSGAIEDLPLSRISFLLDYSFQRDTIDMSLCMQWRCRNGPEALGGESCAERGFGVRLERLNVLIIAR